MSEPSEILDLTALSDALGEDDRQAMAKASERITSQDKQPASIATPSRSSTTSPPVAHSHNTATADIPAAPPKPSQAETLHPDPNVLNIKAMFPDMDVDTIQAVLVADGGDFERAINTLLQMSDPSYVPPPPFQRLSQQEEDERLARSLAAEDERQQNQSIFPSSRGGGLGSLFGGGNSQPSTPQTPSYDPNQLNYQPRVRRTTSGQQRATSESNQGYQSSGGYNGASAAPWPGHREAKVWQEDINKMAEVGFAKAASTFSALRQRGEKAFAGVGQQQGGSKAGEEQARPNTSLPSWASRKSSTLSPTSAVSPTVGSNRGFDQDPTPVGDNELAKILARGREDNKKPSIADRYKKVATNSRSQSKENVLDQGDDDDGEELGWDDAGRTGGSASVAPSFEPIKISDNSEAVDANLKSDLQPDKSKLRLSNTPRNAVSLMEGSAGRGLTSPKASSGKGLEDDGDDDDSNDLEYVSNPFEDED